MRYRSSGEISPSFALSDFCTRASASLSADCTSAPMASRRVVSRMPMIRSRTRLRTSFAFSSTRFFRATMPAAAASFAESMRPQVQSGWSALISTRKNGPRSVRPRLLPLWTSVMSLGFAPGLSRAPGIDAAIGMLEENSGREPDSAVAYGCLFSASAAPSSLRRMRHLVAARERRRLCGLEVKRAADGRRDGEGQQRYEQRANPGGEYPGGTPGALHTRIRELKESERPGTPASRSRWRQCRRRRVTPSSPSK